MQICIAFLGYHESVGRWLLVTDDFPRTLINWAINVFLTVVVLGAIMRPIAQRIHRRIAGEWAEHKQNQRDIVASNEKVAAAVQQTATLPLDTGHRGSTHP